MGWKEFEAQMDKEEEEHYKMVEKMEEYGGDYTPLFVACYFGHIDMVKLLLERGADPTIQTTKGYTAKDVAKQQGHLEIVKLLQEAVDGQ